MARQPAPARSGRREESDGPTWPRVLDVLVWCAVIVLAALAVEFLAGFVVREQISRGFTKLLSRAKDSAPDAPDASA